MKYFIPSLHRLVNTGMKPIWSLPHKQREAKYIFVPFAIFATIVSDFFTHSSLYVPYSFQNECLQKNSIYGVLLKSLPTQPGNLLKKSFVSIGIFFTNTQRAPT